MYVPKMLFLTSGKGSARAELTSFEEALRDADIAKYNLVQVSSIIPPNCQIISKPAGLKKLQVGQILFCVLAKISSSEPGRLMSASVGIAQAKNRLSHGYISEHHCFGKTKQQAGEFAEDLAAQMLATTLGVPFNLDTNYNEKKDSFKIAGLEVKTMNTTKADTVKNGWTTMLAAAVFCA